MIKDTYMIQLDELTLFIWHFSYSFTCSHKKKYDTKFSSITLTFTYTDSSIRYIHRLRPIQPINSVDLQYN